MEGIYSTEDKSEADRLALMLTKDGIASEIKLSGTWFEVLVATADAAQGMRTLTHFLMGE